VSELLTEEHHRSLHGRCADLGAEVKQLKGQLTAWQEMNRKNGETIFTYHGDVKRLKARIEDVKRSADSQNRRAEKAETERDALKAALEKIGGLLGYWGNEGGDWPGKCFRAVEETARQALEEVGGIP